MNNKKLNFRTDMADERVDQYKKVNNLSSIDGVEVITDNIENLNTTTVKVLNENGSRALSKKIGTYITMQIDELEYLEQDQKDKISSYLAYKIKELIGDDSKKSAMIVGLGNEFVTPDALGPKVVKDIEITRHLLKFAKEFMDPTKREVSAICPGVLGTTGIETSEIIESVINRVKPDILIVIDALASGSIKRIGSTIQISNTGITPGEGVRNKRQEICEEKLGIPVIAVGVPTVVSLVTITDECLDLFIDKLEDKNKSNEYLTNLKEQKAYEEVKSDLESTDFNMIVTPKEIDELIDEMSKIISLGINESM